MTIRDNKAAPKTALRTGSGKYRTLISRQDDHARKHDIDLWEKDVKGAKWWLPLSRDREQGSPFTQAIKRSISTPSVHEINLQSRINTSKRGFLYKIDKRSRYEMSDFGSLEREAKNIPFHCLGHKKIEWKSQPVRRIMTANSYPGMERVEKLYHVMGERKTYFDEAIETSKMRPSSVSYDNYWQRLGSMISEQDFQAFSPIQENFALLKDKTEIEKIRKRKTRRMDWIGVSSLDPTPGPGKYKIKRPPLKGGRFNKSKKPLTKIDWVIKFAKEIPSVHDYAPPKNPKIFGGRIATAKSKTYLEVLQDQARLTPGPFDTGNVHENHPKLKLPKGGKISTADVPTWVDDVMRNSRQLPSSADYFEDIIKSNTLSKEGAIGWHHKSHDDRLPDKMKHSEIREIEARSAEIPSVFDYCLYRPSAVKISSKKGGTMSKQQRVTIFEENELVGKSSPNILGVSKYTSMDELKKFHSRKPKKNVPDAIKKRRSKLQSDHRQKLQQLRGLRGPAAYPNTDVFYNKGRGGPRWPIYKRKEPTGECANARECVPGPKYNVSRDSWRNKDGGVSFGRLVSTKKRKHNGKSADSVNTETAEKPSSISTLGSRKQDKASAKFPLTVKVDCCNPFVIIPKSKNLEDIENLVRKQIKQRLKHSLVGKLATSKQYGLWTTDGIKLRNVGMTKKENLRRKSMNNVFSIKISDNIDIEKDCGVIANQTLVWQKVTSAYA